MIEIRFKKPKALDIDGVARAYVAGDVRDYLPENICNSLVACGDAEYVLDAKAEAEAEVEKQHQPKNKEDKLMRPNKKADK